MSFSKTETRVNNFLISKEMIWVQSHPPSITLFAHSRAAHVFFFFLLLLLLLLRFLLFSWCYPDSKNRKKQLSWRINQSSEIVLMAFCCLFLLSLPRNILISSIISLVYNLIDTIIEFWLVGCSDRASIRKCPKSPSFATLPFGHVSVSDVFCFFLKAPASHRHVHRTKIRIR